MVKCSECGFLAIRNRESRVLEETEQITRDEGYLNTAEHEAPICFMRASDLWAESGLNRRIVCHGNVEVLKSTIQKERDCNQFVAWQQGFTPKEHKEMIDRKWEKKWRWIEIGIIIVVTALVNYFIWVLTGYH